MFAGTSEARASGGVADASRVDPQGDRSPLAADLSAVGALLLLLTWYVRAHLGLEGRPEEDGTPLFTLCALVAWLLALGLVEAETRLARPALAFAASALLLGLARPEGVFLGGFMLMSVLAARRCEDARSILKPYLALFLTVGLAYFLWHWTYFDYPLPNPFYAKGAGMLHWHSFRTSWRDLWRLTFPLGILLPS